MPRPKEENSLTPIETQSRLDYIRALLRNPHALFAAVTGLGAILGSGSAAHAQESGSNLPEPRAATTAVAHDEETKVYIPYVSKETIKRPIEVQIASGAELEQELARIATERLNDPGSTDKRYRLELNPQENNAPYVLTGALDIPQGVHIIANSDIYEPVQLFFPELTAGAVVTLAHDSSLARLEFVLSAGSSVEHLIAVAGSEAVNPILNTAEIFYVYATIPETTALTGTAITAANIDTLNMQGVQLSGLAHTAVAATGTSNVKITGNSRFYAPEHAIIAEPGVIHTGTQTNSAKLDVLGVTFSGYTTAIDGQSAGPNSSTQITFSTSEFELPSGETGERIVHNATPGSVILRDVFTDRTEFSRFVDSTGEVILKGGILLWEMRRPGPELPFTNIEAVTTITEPDAAKPKIEIYYDPAIPLAEVNRVADILFDKGFDIEVTQDVARR